MPLLNYNLCSQSFVSRSSFLKCVHLIHFIVILLMASYTIHVQLAPKNHLNVDPDLSAQLQISVLHSPWTSTFLILSDNSNSRIPSQSSPSSSSLHKSVSLPFLIPLEKSDRIMAKNVSSGTSQLYFDSNPTYCQAQATESGANYLTSLCPSFLHCTIEKEQYNRMF